MDFSGLILGINAFIIILACSFYLLSLYDLNRVSILRLLVLSALGHFFGGIFYYWIALKMGADSVFYFNNANLQFSGFGYQFAFMVLGYLRQYVVGNSFLGAFLIFASLGLLGSVFYLLAFKLLLDRLSEGKSYYLVDRNMLVIPAAILLCWPSYLVWSAGLVKDNFAFLSIGIILFVIARGKFSLKIFPLIALAALGGFLVRPYLFVIFTASTTLYALFASKWNVALKFSILCLILSASYVMLPFLSDYASLIKFSGYGSSIGSYALRQQNLMNIGSSIPLPTQNPNLIFLFIPYLALINLLLPLIIGANNAIGVLSSIENAYLFCLLIFLWKNRALALHLLKTLPITKFFILFFSIGMSCLAIMNTNLGLAMREKIMYVPALLIIILLVYAYKKILNIQYRETIKDEHELAEVGAVKPKQG